MKKTFIFESYEFIAESLTAKFTYSFDHETFFTEQVQFDQANEYDQQLLDRVLFLSFTLVGVSYYKLFPGVAIEWRSGEIDAWQSDFLNHIYQEGLGQFAFENKLGRHDLAHFTQTVESVTKASAYQGSGILSLQSGGKDSLLTAGMLTSGGKDFDSFYISSGDSHPKLLDEIAGELHVAKRTIDLVGIKANIAQGGLNGHVPVTYIVLSFALIQALLLNKNIVLASIGHEGEEAHDWIGDLAVNHQWSKTWGAEQLLAEYINRYISPDIKVGSPLRQFSELRVAELFIQQCWQQYGHKFSSCNRANYMQGGDNSELKWCGDCPKCANSYLLFAPFLEAPELQSIFSGQDLYLKQSLQDTFKGLLGIDGAMKPFECVGEVDELRLAYHMSETRGGYGQLPFEVPASDYDYMQQFPHQAWADTIQNQP